MAPVEQEREAYSNDNIGGFLLVYVKCKKNGSKLLW